MTRIAIIGLGGTGTHAAQTTLDLAEHITLSVHDQRAESIERICALDPDRITGHDAPSAAIDGADAAIIATPAGTHGAIADTVIRRGAHVVSLSDAIPDVRDLFDLDAPAEAAGRSVVVGAGFAPGLTCLLARHGANLLDAVDEIAVAKAGTGGPACARQHHRAMKQTAWDWLDGEWFERRGGSGRDLVWFPPNIGARDSYKAALPSPLLLQRSIPEATRIVARVTATRRDRFTSRLPMLRPPHADGGPGAVRVELRGRVDGRFETIVYAVVGHPSHGAGVVGAVAAAELAERGLGAMTTDSSMPAGAFGLSELHDPVPLLDRVRSFGLSIMTFQGTQAL